MSRQSPLDRGATIVTQTRVREGSTDGFARFQATISAAISEQPGFIEQSVLPPNPPMQVDWVILQRFTTAEDAVVWLRSDRRLSLVTEAQQMLAGPDDVHLVRETESGVLPSPVSAVITTRVKPGREAEFRRWEQRIAAAQVHAPGFQGYRFEPPIPGVQQDYVAVLRFETEATMQGWMNSSERQKLLGESENFIEHVQVRTVRAGFSQWFAPQAAATAPVWKQNMVVLLLLYPVVFLFGLWVQRPLLMRAAGLPFWLSLFIGNVASVRLLNWLVPWTNRSLGWWLEPARAGSRRLDLAGAALLLGFYAISMLVFSWA